MSATPCTKTSQETSPRRRILPLVLALALLIIPHIAAAWLHHEANALISQTDATREHLRETIAVIPPEERTDEQNDMILEAWVREGELESKATDYRLYASILQFGGVVMCGTVLFISRRKG